MPVWDVSGEIYFLANNPLVSCILWYFELGFVLKPSAVNIVYFQHIGLAIVPKIRVNIEHFSRTIIGIR